MVRKEQENMFNICTYVCVYKEMQTDTHLKTQTCKGTTHRTQTRTDRRKHEHEETQKYT